MEGAATAMVVAVRVEAAMERAEVAMVTAVVATAMVVMVEQAMAMVAGVTGSSFQLGNFLGPVAAGAVVSATSTYHAAIVFICVVFCIQAVVEARGFLFGFKW